MEDVLNLAFSLALVYGAVHAAYVFGKGHKSWGDGTRGTLITAVVILVVASSLAAGMLRNQSGESGQTGVYFGASLLVLGGAMGIGYSNSRDGAKAGKNGA